MGRQMAVLLCSLEKLCVSRRPLPAGLASSEKHLLMIPKKHKSVHFAIRTLCPLHSPAILLNSQDLFPRMWVVEGAQAALCSVERRLCPSVHTQTRAGFPFPLQMPFHNFFFY